MGKKFTYGYVKNYFEEHGCEILEKKYKGCKIKMNYICNCGNKSEITFESFQKGVRCEKCWIEKIKNKLKFLYKDVKKCFEENGCILLEKEYFNAHIKMKYVCSCGKKGKITFDRFKKGGRCRICGNEKIREKLSGSNNYKWIEDRGLVDRNKIMVNKIRNLLNNTLARIKKKKYDKTYNILGYTAIQLENHICGHPNWKKIKNSKDFHIDHVFPIKAFLDYNIFDAQLINNLDNLQPLSKKENLSKSDKYSVKEFENWLISAGHKTSLMLDKRK